MWLPCIRVPFVFERENDLVKTIVQLQKKRASKQTKGVRNNSVLAHALHCTPVKRANTIIIRIIMRRGTRTSERGKHRKPKMRKSQLQSMQHNYTSVPEQELLDQKKKKMSPLACKRCATMFGSNAVLQFALKEENHSP